MNTNAFPQQPGAETKIKSYWNRPGGKFGTIAGLAILGAVGYFVFPILTTIVWNAVNLGIACVVAFVLYMALSNRKLWLSLFYAYEILMKKLVGVVIEMDPFIIAEDYIKDIEAERDNLYKKTEEVGGEKERIDLKIQEKKEDKIKAMDKAVAARQAGDTMELANQTRQAQRLEEYINKLTPISQNLGRIADYLTKVHKNSKYMLDDMKNDLELKKDLYKSVTKGNNALKSALSIFSGDPEKKLLVEQSMDYLKEDIAGKLASMKSAISYSSDFMKSIDLENASYEAAGLRMLEQYAPETFSHNPQSDPLALNPAAPAFTTPIVLPTVNTKQYENLIR